MHLVVCIRPTHTRTPTHTHTYLLNYALKHKHNYIDTYIHLHTHLLTRTHTNSHPPTHTDIHQYLHSHKHIHITTLRNVTDTHTQGHHISSTHNIFTGTKMLCAGSPSVIATKSSVTSPALAM